MNLTRLRSALILLAVLLSFQGETAKAQVYTPQYSPNGYSVAPTMVSSNLPTGEALNEIEAGTPIIPYTSPIEEIHYPDQEPKMDFSELMRPTISLQSEFQGETNGVQIFSYDTKIKIPTYPIFGPPPPMISFGFSYTDLMSNENSGLPRDLYDYTFGISWMRKLNDRWTMRYMFTTAIATDGNNMSSDAWQFRGGVLAMYQPREDWTWVFGAIALGRNDLPVVPALGAVWTPSDRIKIDLLMPRPRASYLLFDNGVRQQWTYFGLGLNGGTWAYERNDFVDDEITYKDWRMILGWESVPKPKDGMPFARGLKMQVDVGYVFAREFEFEQADINTSLDDTWMLRGFISF